MKFQARKFRNSEIPKFLNIKYIYITPKCHIIKYNITLKYKKNTSSSRTKRNSEIPRTKISKFESFEILGFPQFEKNFVKRKFRTSRARKLCDETATKRVRGKWSRRFPKHSRARFMKVLTNIQPAFEVCRFELRFLFKRASLLARSLLRTIESRLLRARAYPRRIFALAWPSHLSREETFSGGEGEGKK